MRYLCLDVGNKRVGVAVGSSELRIATPLAVIERKRIELDAERVRALVREYEAEAVLVGLPRQDNGTMGEQERLTRAYAAQLEPLVGLPLIYHDERLSTYSALQQQRARGVSEKKGKTTLDASAAAVILQDFLDGLEERD